MVEDYEFKTSLKLLPNLQPSKNILMHLVSESRPLSMAHHTQSWLAPTAPLTTLPPLFLQVANFQPQWPLFIIPHSLLLCAVPQEPDNHGLHHPGSRALWLPVGNTGRKSEGGRRKKLDNLPCFPLPPCLNMGVVGSSSSLAQLSAFGGHSSFLPFMPRGEDDTFWGPHHASWVSFTLNVICLSNSLQLTSFESAAY